jgi:hypothetical protein
MLHASMPPPSSAARASAGARYTGVTSLTARPFFSSTRTTIVCALDPFTKPTRLPFRSRGSRTAESVRTTTAELSGLSDDAAMYTSGTPAACANSGGESPAWPTSRLPALSASSSGGPDGNSTHSTRSPCSRIFGSSAPDAFSSEYVPHF